MNNIGALILTINEPFYTDKIMSLFNNIYVHPKYPETISSKLKPFIIENLIETAWGDMSLVNATINLLEEGLKNKENEYFILLSGDTYPLFSYKKFIKKILLLNKSVFDFWETKTYNDTEFWQASQWFFITRTDAEIIINTKTKYSDFDKLLPKSVVKDELYFLYVLKNEIKNYDYLNFQIMYCRWFKDGVYKHPCVFNKLTDIDLKDMKKSLFLRKTFSNLKKISKLKNRLYIIIIGDKSKQENIVDKYLRKNYIILSFIEMNIVDVVILNNCIFFQHVLWKFKKEAFLNLFNLVDYKYCKQWKNFTIVYENGNEQKFNYESYDTISI